MGRTANRFCIRPQQSPSEFLVLILHFLYVVFFNIWYVSFEVFQSAVQLPENVVQSLDQIRPVLSHPDSTEILKN